MRVESKSTQAVRTLARTLLVLDGKNLAPTRELADQAGVGIGTVSKALEYLSHEGALRAQRIQRYGTIIQHLDYGRLWSLAAYGPVRGILPMPLDRSLEALRVAVTAALECVGVQTVLTYGAGAASRLELVKVGEIDFTVVSEHALAGVGGVEVVHHFGPGSYYGATGIYRLLRRDGLSIERAGAHRDSPDHYDLVRAEFPGLTIVDAPFRSIPHLIVAGEVDATVWYGASPIPGRLINGLRTEPAQSDVAAELVQASADIVVASRGRANNLLYSLDRDQLDHAYAAVIQRPSSALVIGNIGEGNGIGV